MKQQPDRTFLQGPASRLLFADSLRQRGAIRPEAEIRFPAHPEQKRMERILPSQCLAGSSRISQA